MENIKITEDSNSEMLRIEINNKCIFEGNYWDFDRSGNGFKKMLEKIGYNVQLIEKDYDEWYV